MIQVLVAVGAAAGYCFLFEMRKNNKNNENGEVMNLH
jgi:hypothetical protein